MAGGPGACQRVLINPRVPPVSREGPEAHSSWFAIVIKIAATHRCHPKAHHHFQPLTARLKSCPFKAATYSESPQDIFGAEPSPQDAEKTDYSQNAGGGIKCRGAGTLAPPNPTPPPGTAGGWFPHPWRRPSSGRSGLAAGWSARYTRSPPRTESGTAR